MSFFPCCTFCPWFKPNLKPTYIRFLHASPNTPRGDLTLLDGTVLFRNVGFGESTAYISLEEGVHTLQVRLTESHSVVLTVPDLHVKKNHYYTVFAMGLMDGTPPLQALLIQDDGKC